MPFPWDLLPQVPRAALRARHALAMRLGGGASLSAVRRVLEELLGEPVRLEPRTLCAMPGEPLGSAARLRFALPEHQLDLVCCIDPRLVTRLLSGLLEVESRGFNPLATLEPELLGAAAALLVTLVERAELGYALRFASAMTLPPGGLRFQQDMLLRIGGAAYDLTFGVRSSLLSSEHSAPVARLETLGMQRLALPLVVGLGLMTRAELHELELGAAWLPGDGWWLGPSGEGRALLLAANAERGWPVELGSEGQIVLGERAVSSDSDDLTLVNPPPSDDSLQGLLLDAPVVVRLELGEIALPARQWASLSPGALLETRVPIGQLIALRVGGRIVARGELVNVDGELGIRIRELVAGDPQ